MAAPSDPDSFADPETGRVVDPGVLAELRARRAELTDDGGLERVQRTVVTLEQRLDAANGRLIAAERDRGTLAAGLERAERELTAALQREFAEQRRRVELEGEAGGAVRSLEAEVARLRAEQRTADRRTAELVRALAVARGGVDAARAETELALAAERERAAAEVRLLRHELERRVTVHDAVSAQIAGLRSALDAVRVRADAAAAEQPWSDRALAEAVAHRERLRTALAAREEEQRDAEVRLEEARAELHARETEVEALRARTGQLGRELAEERLRRTALEALVEVERARFAAELATAEHARRAEGERLRSAHEAARAAVQRTVDGLRAERDEAFAELERRAASEQTAPAASARERGTLGADAELLRSRLAAAEAALADEQRLAAAALERTAALDLERDARLAGAASDMHRARARAESAEAVRSVLEAELGGRTMIGERTHGRLAEPRGELDDARSESAPRAEHDPGRLAGDLTSAIEHAGLEARLAGVREQLARTSGPHGEEGQSAQPAAGTAAIERSAGERAAALPAAPAPGSAPAGDSPVYGLPPASALAGHPALARPEAPGTDRGEPPTVIVDLARASARLRGEGEGLEFPADARNARHAGPELAAPAVAAPADARRPLPPAPQPRPAPAHEVPAPPPAAPTTRAWFGAALVDLAAIDAATAERLLLAALPVQAHRVAKDVTYLLELPATGHHHVRVRRQGEVLVAPGGTAARDDVEFRLEGPVEALVPLVAGAAPRRLRGFVVRGRRRRLRRLLRALADPVGLSELQAAGVRPRPGDLLALLCLGVQAQRVRGADFCVAYVVVDAEGGRDRTLVRAEPDGTLTAIPEAPDLFAADATVTVGAEELLSLLAGTTPVAIEGDAQAVTTLQGWLQAVQGLPA